MERSVTDKGVDVSFAAVRGSSFHLGEVEQHHRAMILYFSRRPCIICLALHDDVRIIVNVFDLRIDAVYGNRDLNAYIWLTHLSQVFACCQLKRVNTFLGTNETLGVLFKLLIGTRHALFYEPVLPLLLLYGLFGSDGSPEILGGY